MWSGCLGGRMRSLCESRGQGGREGGREGGGLGIIFDCFLMKGCHGHWGKRKERVIMGNSRTDRCFESVIVGSFIFFLFLLSLFVSWLVGLLLVVWAPPFTFPLLYSRFFIPLPSNPPSLTIHNSPLLSLSHTHINHNPSPSSTSTSSPLSQLLHCACRLIQDRVQNIRHRENPPHHRKHLSDKLQKRRPLMRILHHDRVKFIKEMNPRRCHRQGSHTWREPYSLVQRLLKSKLIILLRRPI